MDGQGTLWNGRWEGTPSQARTSGTLGKGHGGGEEEWHCASSFLLSETGCVVDS